MGEFFKTIGMVIVVAWLAGAVGAIDFELCIQPVGQCAAHQPAKEPQP